MAKTSAERMRKHRAARPDCEARRQQKEKARRFQARLDAIEHYGGECAVCGEDNPIYLVLDHVNDDGNEHRRNVRLGRGGCMAAYLRAHGWPNDPPIQVLCWNHNAVKAYYPGAYAALLKGDDR